MAVVLSVIVSSLGVRRGNVVLVVVHRVDLLEQVGTGVNHLVLSFAVQLLAY